MKKTLASKPIPSVDVWPPAPTAPELKGLNKTKKHAITPSGWLGIASLASLFFAVLLCTKTGLVSGTAILPGLNALQSIQVLRRIVLVLSVCAVILGGIGWRSWPGKISSCLSIIFFLAIHDAYETNPYGMVV